MDSSTKDRVLALLEKDQGAYFSGETIADTLGISRTAVWKSVNALRKCGYDIVAVPNRGYCLSSAGDILSKQGIRKYLVPACDNISPEVFDEVASTNTLAKELAAKGAPEGCVIIAASQTGGRGRRGRTFYSPSDTGIYLSMILRPSFASPQETIRLTTVAAVAACEAIEKVSGRKALIKWVNDIFLDGRKAAGILTEASFDLESGVPDFIILGIGFNAYSPEGGFPEDIRDIAGSVFNVRRDDQKNRLAAEFINCFMSYYRAEGFGEYAGEYRARSLAIGHEVNVISASGIRPAVAVDVDDECRLLVRYPDGSTEKLYSGEISIKLR